MPNNSYLSFMNFSVALATNMIFNLRTGSDACAQKAVRNMQIMAEVACRPDVQHRAWR